MRSRTPRRRLLGSIERWRRDSWRSSEFIRERSNVVHLARVLIDLVGDRGAEEPESGERDERDHADEDHVLDEVCTARVTDEESPLGADDLVHGLCLLQMVVGRVFPERSGKWRRDDGAGLEV